jgi:hypothetical protein
MAKDDQKEPEAVAEDRATPRGSPEREAERRKELDEYAANRYTTETLEQEELAGLAAEGIQWLQEKWGEEAPECPYCKADFWYVAPPVVLPTLPRGTLFPAFPVVCTNCGHTTFVSAAKAGIANPFEEPG